MPSSVSRSDDGNIVSSLDFEGYEGLSKREHFAGLAMQGFASGPECDFRRVSTAAALAVEWADALLEELAK
jgi:hypothetical protein